MKKQSQPNQILRKYIFENKEADIRINIRKSEREVSKFRLDNLSRRSKSMGKDGILFSLSSI